jgi:hypothetical protein
LFWKRWTAATSTAASDVRFKFQISGPRTLGIFGMQSPPPVFPTMLISNIRRCVRPISPFLPSLANFASGLFFLVLGSTAFLLRQHGSTALFFPAHHGVTDFVTTSIPPPTSCRKCLISSFNTHKIMLSSQTASGPSSVSPPSHRLPRRFHVQQHGTTR